MTEPPEFGQVCFRRSFNYGCGSSLGLSCHHQYFGGAGPVSFLRGRPFRPLGFGCGAGWAVLPFRLLCWCWEEDAAVTLPFPLDHVCLWG